MLQIGAVKMGMEWRAEASEEHVLITRRCRFCRGLYCWMPNNSICLMSLQQMPTEKEERHWECQEKLPKITQKLQAKLCLTSQGLLANTNWGSRIPGKYIRNYTGGDSLDLLRGWNFSCFATRWKPIDNYHSLIFLKAFGEVSCQILSVDVLLYCEDVMWRGDNGKFKSLITFEYCCSPNNIPVS